MMDVTRKGGNKPRSTALLVAWALAAALAAGCTVLTERQVEAVAKFADATRGFGTSPAAVVTLHADLRRERGLLKASTRTDAEAATADLENALRQEAGLEKLAMSSSAAMQVLDDYAEMLGVLSSSRFTDDLQNKTVSLGASIDNSIATFNKGSGSNLNSFGDIVAGIVRAGGGIWIRHKQERALSAAVTHAERPVGELTEAVEALMQAYLAPPPNDPNSPNLFESEATELREMFPRLRGSRGWDIETLERTQVFRVRSQDGVELARSCASAAKKYREAHAQLVRAITDDDADLATLIAEIRVLADEVKAGKRVRIEVGKARKS